MAPDEQEQTPVAEDAEDEPGIFGNLPKTRPGARSPRRDAAAARRSASAAKEAASPKAPKRKPAAPPPPPPGRAEPPPPEPRAEPQGGGIEDVAWAGVAAVAEAATIGVRLANRALEAMRDTVDRR